MRKLIHKLPGGTWLLSKWRNFSGKDKIIYKNVSGAFLVNGLALLVSFFTMPAYMRYLDNQQILGVWFTLISILIWILNFDLGIGNGLRNHLAAALAKNDWKAAQKYISSAYFVLGTVVILLAIIGYFGIGWIPWNQIFNISEDIISSVLLVQVARYTFLGIMCFFFLRIISSVIYAMQKSALNSVLGLMTNSLLLGVVLLAPVKTLPHNLLVLSISYGICLNLPLLVATIIIFSSSLKNCIPQWKCVSWNAAKAILSLGGIFFVCQILYMCIANTNEFFITQYTGAADVVDYQIYNRVFSLVSVFFALILTPIWSVVTKAASEQDYTWLIKLNKRLLKLAALFSLLEILIIPFLPFILTIWLGKKAIPVHYEYACIFAVFGASMLFQNVVSVITNGLGRMRLQAACYGGGIIIKIMLIHVGIYYWHSWILVVLANALILIPYIILQNRANTIALQRGIYVN